MFLGKSEIMQFRKDNDKPIEFLDEQNLFLENKKPSKRIFQKSAYYFSISHLSLIATSMGLYSPKYSTIDSLFVD